jgi:hypothetical protein
MGMFDWGMEKVDFCVIKGEKNSSMCFLSNGIFGMVRPTFSNASLTKTILKQTLTTMIATTRSLLHHFTSNVTTILRQHIHHQQ